LENNRYKMPLVRGVIEERLPALALKLTEAK